MYQAGRVVEGKVSVLGSSGVLTMLSGFYPGCHYAETR